MMTLKSEISSNQYVVYDGNGVHVIDLGLDDYTVGRFERLPDVTLGAIKADRPELYRVIEDGGIEGLDDGYPVHMYEIDGGDRICVIDDWQ